MPQAPKTLPPGAKQLLVLTYLQSSFTVHTLKDLEKALPSVASINSMQVKEYLQALSDEGKIHVEKIGSGNWYWSFLSEEKKTRDDMLSKLKEEEQKIIVTVQELQERIQEAAGKRDGGEDGRQELIAAQAKLTEEVFALKEEVNEYRDGDPAELIRKKTETRKYREMAHRWTENLEILEDWLGKAVGGDKEKLEGIKRTYYGEEYEEGVGLREL